MTTASSAASSAALSAALSAADHTPHADDAQAARAAGGFTDDNA